MLITDEQLLFNEYNFKSSPESSSGDSFLTGNNKPRVGCFFFFKLICVSFFFFLDYDNLPSDEDFLQQLSTELDIPLLLNQGEDELSVLNSLLASSTNDGISSCSSPLENDLKETHEIREELEELQVGVNNDFLKKNCSFIMKYREN